jgi:LysR family glycine cleavage system transcriptional activator
MASPAALRFPSHRRPARLRGRGPAGQLRTRRRRTARSPPARWASAWRRWKTCSASPLFTRPARSLALTAGGRDYLDQVRSALACWRRCRSTGARRSAGAAARQRAAHLRAPGAGARAAARSRRPTRTSSWSGAVDPVPGRQAAGSRRRGGAHRRCSGRAHAAGRRGAADGAPGAAGPLPALRHPADLSGAPLLRTPIEPWTPWFAPPAWTGRSPTDGPRLVDLGLTLEAALGGQGVVLGRPSLARHALADGRLLPLFGPFVRGPQRYYRGPAATDGAAAEFCPTGWCGCCARIGHRRLALVQDRLAPPAGSRPRPKNFPACRGRARSPR